jgi:hypothetical protein
MLPRAVQEIPEKYWQSCSESVARSTVFFPSAPICVHLRIAFIEERSMVRAGQLLHRKLARRISLTSRYLQDGITAAS